METKPSTHLGLRTDTAIGRTAWMIQRRTGAIDEFRRCLAGGIPEKWKGVERQTIIAALEHETQLLEDLLSPEYYETTIKPELDKIRTKYLCKEDNQ